MVDEEEITFAPTYRFERDTREKYVYTKAKATGVSFRSQLWLFFPPPLHTLKACTLTLEHIVYIDHTVYMLQ